MKFLLSVDVEDWFQVDNLKQAISRDSWEGNISRVERNVDIILEQLNRHNSKATFFILGWIAERFPKLIKKIHSQNHEIACHGYNHDLVYSLSSENFRQDVSRTKYILENITGEKVIGYRAPNFSITDWAIDELISMGFRYDSSLFLTFAHNRYGKLKHYKVSGNTIFNLKDDFYQVMLSNLDMLRIKIPWSGGFYFRFIPYPIFKMGISKILKNKEVYVFYIHPWEFDPAQPKVRNISLQYKFRHYVNLKNTELKFKKLLSDFTFSTIKTAIPNNQKI
jgi:polysaccharide deacetylase family protein (PEP-CTERM system associated)